MREYQGYPISNFRVGFDEAVEPWLLPRDAFQLLKNAHLYRGVVEKIKGYSFFAQMSYRKEVALSGTIDGANKTFTGTLSPLPTTQNITVQSTIDTNVTMIETFMDDGNGVLTGSNGGTGTINYLNGAVSVTFGAAAPVDLTTGGIQYNSVLLIYDFATSGLPIMGIQPYFSISGSQDILIFDTRRVGKIIVLTGLIAQDQQSDYGISELPHDSIKLDLITFSAAKTFTGTLGGSFLPGDVTFSLYDSDTTTAALLGTIVDNGAGRLTGLLLDPANPSTTNLINYATGEFTLTFLANRASTEKLNSQACVYGDLFTGDFTNFISLTNYQAKAFFTNNLDPPMYYDGVCVHYLNTNLTPKVNVTPPYDLTRVLHIIAYRERLILLAPTVIGVPALNTAYWSVAGNPLDFTNDEFLQASTSDGIRAYGIINTDLVVRFSNSERIFRYTGDAFSPFAWDLTNVVWRCDASYSAINYDSWFSSVGQPGIVRSDGVNVTRADELIPDFTLNQRVDDDEQQPVPSIDQGSISQCYGQRFDDFKEGWLCYKAYDTNDDLSGVQPSDTILAFNYIDETYSVYTFPFSVLGFGRILASDVWGNNFKEWGDANTAWNSYIDTKNALIDLAGDQNGTVYEIGTSNTLGTPTEAPALNPVMLELITMNFNPYVESGQFARFGYVDFFVSSDDDTTFRVQFYLDDKLDTTYSTYYQESVLTLTATKQSKVWKRIYVGAVGKSHTMRIYQNIADFTVETINQPIRIHAIVPYFKPAGRIFQ